MKRLIFIMMLATLANAARANDPDAMAAARMLEGGKRLVARALSVPLESVDLFIQKSGDYSSAIYTIAGRKVQCGTGTFYVGISCWEGGRKIAYISQAALNKTRNEKNRKRNSEWPPCRNREEELGARLGFDKCVIMRGPWYDKDRL